MGNLGCVHDVMIIQMTVLCVNYDTCTTESVVMKPLPLMFSECAVIVTVLFLFW